VAAAAGPTLTQRHLNRALLGRQLLLDRADVDVPNALEKMAGLQAQYAPAMYIGLWTRLRAFGRDDLTGALERRTVVQGTLLRSTIHLVSARDYWPFALAVRETRRAWWLGQHRNQTGTEDIAASAARLRDHLRRDTPIHRKQIEAIVGKERAGGVGLWLDLVRVPPSGTWGRRRADLFAAAEDWLGPPPADVDAEAGLDHIVRRYLAGFGPATVAEIALWAGLRPGVVTAVLGRIPTRTFRAEDGNELVDLARAPRPDPDTPAPVRFLAVWDAMLLVHARRAGIVPEEYRPQIFTSNNPQSLHTFLVDGKVAGSWRYEQGRIELDPFAPLDARARRELADEAERLVDLHR
jgi:hypothetical protein